jgi:adenylate cyclase
MPRPLSVRLAESLALSLRFLGIALSLVFLTRDKVGPPRSGKNKLLYFFEDYALETDRRELRRGDDLVPVEPKVFDLLVHLIGARERVVSKEDLIAGVWMGRIVSDSALTSCLNAARIAIGDSGGAQRLIRTLPRKGVRFIGTVREEHGPAGLQRSIGPPRPRLDLPDQPSVAVLPLANVSGDSEQEYLADGIADEIIIQLSSFPELFVIAGNSSFKYKNSPMDVRQIGHELGVRYVLEGSIRRSGSRVRISAQLVDAASGVHRWAKRYDRELSDIFALQEEVAAAIVPVLAAHVNKAEVERTLRKAPSTWDALDFYLRGSDTFAGYLSSYDATTLHEARRLFERSVSADPKYARAYAGLSHTYFTAWFHHLDRDFLKPETLDRAIELARMAVRLDGTLPMARAQLGMVLTYKRRHDEAIAEFERGQALNANFNDWRFANILAYAGEAARTIDVCDRLFRLDPFYQPLAAGFLGLANYLLRRYQRALVPLVDAAGRAPRQRAIRQWLAATYAQLGERDRAQEEAAAILTIEPDYTIRGVAEHFSPYRHSADAEHLFEGLRKAGLPED